MDNKPTQHQPDGAMEAYKTVLANLKIGTIIEINSHDTNPPSTGELTVVYSADGDVETTLVEYGDNYWKIKEEGDDLIVGETEDGRINRPDPVITFSIVGYDPNAKL